MDRKEFLAKLGIGAAFALTSTCLGSCSRDVAPVEKDIDFTIDLNDYKELETIGGYVVLQEEGIVVARSISGEYVAATVKCSHEEYDRITYRDTDGVWFCTLHGAVFTEEGKGQNNEGRKNLTIYKTEKEENKLRVFS